MEETASYTAVRFHYSKAPQWITAIPFLYIIGDWYEKTALLMFCVMLCGIVGCRVYGRKGHAKKLHKNMLNLMLRKDLFANAVDLDRQTPRWRQAHRLHNNACVSRVRNTAVIYKISSQRYDRFCRQNQNGENRWKPDKGYEIFQLLLSGIRCGTFGNCRWLRKETSKGTEKTTACAGFHRCQIFSVFLLWWFRCGQNLRLHKTAPRSDLMAAVGTPVVAVESERLKLWAGTGTAVGESDPFCRQKRYWYYAT